jgi:hypothetical protein
MDAIVFSLNRDMGILILSRVNLGMLDLISNLHSTPFFSFSFVILDSRVSDRLSTLFQVSFAITFRSSDGRIY